MGREITSQPQVTAIDHGHGHRTGEHKRLLGAIGDRRRAIIGAMKYVNRFIRRLWSRLRRRCPECGARPVYWDEECWWCGV